MSIRTFLIGLILSILLSAGGNLLLLGFIPESTEHTAMAWVTLFLFAFFCGAFFAAGKLTARSTNRNAFTGVIFASIFAKLFFSLIFLLAYQKVAEPGNSWFVAFFFISYLVFTVFEVWFLVKVGKDG